MPAVGFAEALVEERCRCPDQFDVRQIEFGAAADESVGLAHVRGQHAATAQEVVEQFAGLLGVEQAVVAHLEPQGGNQVIQKVLSDLGGVVGDTDAQFGEFLLVTDSGQHQQLGRVHRASAHHHLPSGPDRPPTAVRVVVLHSGRPGALEGHPSHAGVGEQGQVATEEHRLQVGVGATPSRSAALGDRGLTEPIQYRSTRGGHPVAGLFGRTQPRRRRGPGAALGRDHQGGILDSVEIGAQVRVVPIRAGMLGPLVVVGGKARNPHHRVQR